MVVIAHTISASLTQTSIQTAIDQAVAQSRVKPKSYTDHADAESDELYVLGDNTHMKDSIGDVRTIQT